MLKVTRIVNLMEFEVSYYRLNFLNYSYNQCGKLSKHLVEINLALRYQQMWRIPVFN